MSNYNQALQEPIWRHLTVDVSQGPLDPIKLKEIDDWIWRATGIHLKTLFVKLRISMPELNGVGHARLLGNFKNYLFVKLCEELTYRFLCGEQKKQSIVRLLWSRTDEENLEVYLCLNGALWKAVSEKNAVSNIALAKLIEESWCYALANSFPKSAPRKDMLVTEAEWFLDEKRKDFSTSYNSLFLSMSTMARLSNGSKHMLSFAQSSASTSAVNVGL